MQQLSLEPVINKNLFSKHYLEKRLPESTKWRVDEEKLKEVFEELEKIYEREKNNLPKRTSDEEGLRDEFITPILKRVLGFEKEKEKSSRSSSERPDYALYRNKELKDKAVQTGDYYEYAIGILEAKPWEANLEKKKKSGGQATEDNPTRQIVDYLIENKPQWGILTNGRKWRLYHREESNRLDAYYEIDLITLIKQDRPLEEKFAEFKYFYLFFRRASFEGKEGKKFLDKIREKSIKYAEEIGEDLEENVYQALEWMAKGFLEIKKNKERGIENKSIETIHNNCLILLYRLLFALYADARGMLGNPGEANKDYSFSHFVTEICENIDEGHEYSGGGLLWSRLWEIFSLINKGSEAKRIPKDDFHVPAYNGGLFDPEKHPFLEEYTLSDRYLAKVIDLIARTEKGEQKGKAQVDYFDLSVRHLGGIYEGLLEYQLKIADKDLVEVKKSGDIITMPLKQAKKEDESFSKEDIIREGKPYLITDRGERKATGSYYTPDYIVKYIVENTIGPVLEDKIEEFETDKERAEALLDLKVLDPAMGSGHFLVEAIDFIASELVNYTEMTPKEAKRKVAKRCVYGVDLNPLATELAKVSIWLNTISKNKPLSFLNHHLKVGNSLIGADIHNINQHPEEEPEEGEESGKERKERQATLGEEFGDGGAGVIRANVKEMLKMFKDIQERREQSPDDIKKQEEIYKEFLKFPFRRRFDIVADVYTSYYFGNEFNVDDYNRLLQAFKRSGQKEEEDPGWEEIIQEEFVRKASDSLSKPRDDNLSEKRNFFHWKLEFPEIFFDIEEGVEKENPGFDVVVGNPPYFTIRGKGTGTLTQTFYYDYLKQSPNWKDQFRSQSDVYYYFIMLSIDLLSKAGKFGYIIENYWLENDYADRLKREILNKTKIDLLTNFGEIKIFKDAGNDTCILIFKKEDVTGNEFKNIFCKETFPGSTQNKQNRKLVSHIIKKSGKESYSDKYIDIFNVNQGNLGTGKWILSTKIKILELLKKDGKNIFPLGDINNKQLKKYSSEFPKTGKSMNGLCKIGQGVVPGNKTVFCFSERGNTYGGLLTKEDRKYFLVRNSKNNKNYKIKKDVVRNFLTNEDISRYGEIDTGKYIFYPIPIQLGNKTKKNYSGLMDYLKVYKKTLEKRFDSNEEKYPWFGYQRPQNLGLWDKSKKIVCPYRSKRNSFALDLKTHFATTDSYAITVKKDSDLNIKYLLGLLNSSLLTFWYKEAGKAKGSMLEYFSNHLRRIPIYKPIKNKQKPVANLVEKIIDLKKKTFNLNLKDYLGSYDFGKTLDDLYIPVEGVSDTILKDTKDDKENLKIGNINFEKNKNELILKVSAKYKPEDEDEHKTDQWGYTETDLIPGMKFSGSEEMLALIEEFTKFAVDKAGGFAGFREKTTKNKSIIDRFKEIKLPKLEYIESDLEKYLENKEKAEKLENKIKDTDNQIDALVFDLYDLAEDEVKIVLDSLDTPEDEKEDILEKFGKVKD